MKENLPASRYFPPGTYPLVHEAHNGRSGGVLKPDRKSMGNCAYFLDHPKTDAPLPCGKVECFALENFPIHGGRVPVARAVQNGVETMQVVQGRYCFVYEHAGYEGRIALPCTKVVFEAQKHLDGRHGTDVFHPGELRNQILEQRKNGVIYERSK